MSYMSHVYECNSVIISRIVEFSIYDHNPLYQPCNIHYVDVKQL